MPLGPLELLLAGSYRYVSELQTTIVGAPGDPTINDPRGLADARHLVDMSGSTTFDIGKLELRASIFVRNLLDDRGLSSALPVAGLFTFGAGRPPRQFGGEIGFSF